MQNRESYIGPEEIIRKKNEFLIPCVYHFYNEPMQIVRGEGQYLFDHREKRYLDFYGGVSVLSAGHCHPEIVEKISDQVKTLQHTTTIYLTQPIVDLAERLAQITPGSLRKSFFCASGSEANEGALLLSQLYTGRHEFLSLYNSLHGRTKLTMSVTGLKFWRTDSNPVGGISFVPGAYCYRCIFNLKYPDCNIECARQIENVIEKCTSGEVAALIGDVRGKGLMLGAELVNQDKEPATKETDTILEYMKDRGVLIGKTGAGRNVLTFQPPLIITKDNIDEVIDVLDGALSYVEKYQE